MPILTQSNFINEDDASQYAQSLKNQYPDDINKEKLTEEFQLFYKLSDKFKTGNNGTLQSALDVLNKIYNIGLESVLSEICICLRLVIVIPVSVASGERTFSKLSLIKNYF